MTEKSRGMHGVFRRSPRAPCPAHEPGPGVDPAVLRSHLRHAGRAEAEEAENEANGGIDRVELEREQGAFEQRKVDESDGSPEYQHVEGDVPPGPPGCRDCAACEKGSSAAHHHGHEQEQPDIVFLVEDAVHPPASTSWRPPSRYADFTSGRSSSCAPVPESVITPLTI